MANTIILDHKILLSSENLVDLLLFYLCKIASLNISTPVMHFASSFSQTFLG